MDDVTELLYDPVVTIDHIRFMQPGNRMSVSGRVAQVNILL